MCIRFNFALQEVRVIIPILIYRYQFEKVGTELIEYDVLVSFYARVKRRTSWLKKSKAKGRQK